VLTRYSVLAQTAVVTLVLTGTYQAWRILRGDPLTGSGYTRLLVFKVAAFGVLLCLGAASRSMVRRRYLRPLRAAAGGPTRAEAPRSARREARRTRRYDVAALRVMRQSVALELAIAAGVLGLTAALVASSPLAPGPSLRPAGVYNGPYRTEVALTGGGSVLVWLDPARPGSNDLVLDVRDGSGLNRGVPEVRANLVGLAPVTAPAPVTLTRTGVGQYVAHRLPLIGAGTWRLDITVRTSDIDEERVSAMIPVS
ncbi:MAG TPA: CopD family protein, partial [Rugosimonospora sp.]|nr:CopD family protein [Rugosimonospora sp.]